MVPDNKRFFFLGGLVVILLFIFWYARVHATQTFTSCTQAKAEGVHDIRASDSRYKLYLDRDKNGIACEL